MKVDGLDYPFESHPEPGATRLVADGVHWVRMPLPFALDHINLWLLDDGDELAVVDTGIGLDEIRPHWEQVFAEREGAPIGRIVVTHCHPDHLGQAAWLQAKSGAPLWMTQGEFLGGHALWHQLPGHSVTDMLAQFRANGLDEDRCAALEKRGNGYRRVVPDMPTNYHRLFDGDEICIGAERWQVMVGFGHAPEHASLYCARLGVLISGDMLLPRISTNISVFAATPQADPLGWFLDSLQRTKSLPNDTLVLPSHGYPFRGLHERVDQLVAHHAERCDVLLAACDRPRSAGDLLETLFPRALDTHQVMFAMGEAIAHLNHLTQQGALRREERDGRIRYLRTA